MGTDPVRFGIVGLGRSGWNIHVDNLRPRDDAQIVAVSDPLEERRQEAANEFGCQTYKSIDEMLKQDDIEVAVIATPSVLHGPDTLKSFAAGKHVIVEKPMAMNVVEADQMIAASKKADLKLFVHQNWRFNRVFTHLKDVAESGKIGRLYHIRNYSSGFSRRDDWQTLARNGGGVLNNTCPHYLDMLIQLSGGAIKDVMGDLQQIASAGDVEDHVKAFLRAKNGCTIDMETSSAQNVAIPLPSWILCGTSGTLTSDGKQSTIRWYDPEEAGSLEVRDVAAVGRKYGSESKPLNWQEEIVETRGPDIGNFYDNVTGVLRRDEKMIVTPESVREVIRVMVEIRKGTGFPGFNG
ncbi:MAG: Gfo/Idh/MocA family oxidoreductase [Planctomycetota bacterium]|nr:Gfo/Idh/MocA family oxidoreductase [Planctomycetota bacterium]